MKRSSISKKLQFILVGLALVFTGLLPACRSTSQVATPLTQGISVGITSDTCPNIIIRADQQVTWINQDSREHIVRHNPVEGNGQFDSGTLQPRDVFTFTFLQIGEYKYICSTDGTMTGIITVET
jgi:hypothetical protein